MFQQSESINKVIKSVQEWHEMSIDCVILALHYLQGYHLTEFFVDRMAWGFTMFCQDTNIQLSQYLNH